MLRTIELVLGFIGAFLCAYVALATAPSQAPIEWPLPGLVFLDLILYGLLGLAAAARDAGSARSAWGYVPWAVTGALAALVVLAGFSIGGLLIPSTVCFLAVGLLSKNRWGTRLPLSIGLAIVAVVAQTAQVLLPWVL